MFKQEIAVTPYYMEEQLDMPLRQVLSIMQDRVMNETSYFGVKALRSPIDSWIYQELIVAAKPDVIVEIGNELGGGLLILAHLCDLLGHGRVIGVDLEHDRVPDAVRNHARITLIDGDACDSFSKVRKLVGVGERVLVIEDSAHTYENTLDVLRLYSNLISPGDYFIVEDSICHHGLTVGPSPGPYEAIEDFIKENAEFEIDRSRESFLITWNPKGYIRRKSSPGSTARRSTTPARPRLPARSTLRHALTLFVPPIVTQIVVALRDRAR
jgi:cephalosporin hydroxylase